MAERNSEMEIGLEMEITCIVCHEHYTDPKVLPCFHYYCKKCISLLASKSGDGRPFPCPECREDTTLPEGGVDNLPTAFFVNRIKALYAKQDKSSEGSEAKQIPTKQMSAVCESCSEDEPEAFCQQCQKYICGDCIRSHQKRKIFSGHNIVQPSEMGKGQEATVHESSFQTCNFHDKVLNYYCYDCNSLICATGTAEKHKNHHYEFLKVAVPEMKKKLTQQMSPLKEVESKLAQALKDVQAARNDVEDQEDAIVEYIMSSFNELHQILKNQEEHLLAEVTEKITKKSKHLSVQEKSLISAHKAIQGALIFTEQSMKHSTDADIMCTHAEILCRLEKVLQNEEGS